MMAWQHCIASIKTFKIRPRNDVAASDLNRMVAARNLLWNDKGTCDVRRMLSS
jgi:hypothetical protein